MPAGVTTLLAIRTATRQRADIVNSQYITDSELNGYINASYYELYDLLIQKYGDNYYVSSSTITTDGTNDNFALPADFYKLLGVDLRIGTSPASYMTLRRFEMIDRNANGPLNPPPSYGISALRYRLNGANLWITAGGAAVPAGGQVLKVWYIPRLTALSADGDTVDGISGWEEYIVTDAAIKCMIKEESDVSGLMAQKQGLIRRIESAAENRDAGQPPTVSDVQNCGGWYPFGSGWGP